MENMKHYEGLIRADDKWEHLSTYANNRTEAKELIIEAYNGFKDMGYVKDFGYITCWEID